MSTRKELKTSTARAVSASPTPQNKNSSEVKSQTRSRSSPLRKDQKSSKPLHPVRIAMASQEELDLLKAEIELLKARLTTAEDTIRQQAGEIATLSAAVARLDAASVEKSVRSPLHSAALPVRSKKQSGSTGERQVSASHPPPPIRRSSVTASGKTTGSKVPKSATSAGISTAASTTPQAGAPKSGEKGARPQSSPRKQQQQQKPRASTARNAGALAKTKEASYDRETNVLRLYLRGRSITLPAPSTSAESFDITRPTEAPTEMLKLEWAHGFRGKQILLLPTGELVYPCAALVVLFQPTGQKSQRFYAEHTDDVKCLALHPDRVTMASGQVAGHDKSAGRPHVRIWNSVTLQTLRVLGLEGGFDRALAALSFSKADSGALLAAVDDSNEHVMSIYNWSNGHKLGDTRTATDALLGIEFNPTANSPAEIATWGRFGLIWWTVTQNQGTALNSTQTVRIARLKQATFDAKDRPRVITSAVYSNDGSLLIAGDSNGGLSWWTRGSTRMGRLLPGAHANGAVSCCYVSPDAEWLLSAGAKDHTIIKWNIRNEPPTVISKLQLPSSATVRAMQLSGNGSSFYIGTSGGSILLTNGIEEGASLTPLIQGHSEEVWGVSTHPSNPALAVSVGYDRLLVVWNVVERQCVAVRELQSAGHSVAFHKNGQIVAVGLRSGEWLAVDLTEELSGSSPASACSQPAKVCYSDHPAHEQIECLAFSPDGSYIAVGSRDQQIYVYSVSDGAPPTFARVSRCAGHSSFITHLDWTTDSKYLRSNSGDYELLFWEAATGRQVLFGSISKEQEQLNSNEVLEVLREPSSWATHSCTLAFSSAGIWPDGADGTDINCADKAHAKNLMAIGDDFGKVRLFRWPCSAPRSLSSAANGHSSHVTSAMFVCDDARLLSAGGRDAALLQWSITTV